MTEEIKDVFKNAITKITDPENVWNEENYGHARINGKAFGDHNTSFNMHYVLGHAFMIGVIGDMQFKCYCGQNIGWQWYDSRDDAPMGEGFGNKCDHTPFDKVDEFLTKVQQAVAWQDRITQMINDGKLDANDGTNGKVRVLSPEAWDRLETAMNAPADPSPELIKLMTTPPRYKTE